MDQAAGRIRGTVLCLLIAPNAPHAPLFVPQKYRDPYASLPHDQASFFGMIANIDENMGKLEQTLIRQACETTRL